MCDMCDDYIEEWDYLNEWDAEDQDYLNEWNVEDDPYDPANFYPDYYDRMLAAMESDDTDDFVLDETVAVIDRLRNAKYARINANSFVHHDRRIAGKTRAFYKKQAHRQERLAGSEMLRSMR